MRSGGNFRPASTSSRAQGDDQISDSSTLQGQTKRCGPGGSVGPSARKR